MVAAYLGIKPQNNANALEEAASFVPVNKLGAADFDQLLTEFGL
jgi:hypothetical protein